MSVHDENDTLTQANSRVGTVLRGKYTVDGVLGVGGMAAVFAVTHQNGQRFALKLLHPELARQESVRKRFVREGSAANSVAHDGAVKVYDNDVDESGAPFLLMELLDGVSVNSLWLPPHEQMPLRETLGIAVQLLDVLIAAHEQGIVHRDIKPSNLFVTKGGAVKVLDFGIAQLRQSALELTRTTTGTTLGSPPYMAPEQARAKTGEIDMRTDIWAVGATLFTMLSGKYVHEGDNADNIRVIAATEPARSLSAVAPDIPSQVVKIVDKALAFEKGDRFKTAAAMRDAVAEVLSEFYGSFSSDILISFVSRVEGACKDVSRDSSQEGKVKPKPTEIDSSQNRLAVRPSTETPADRLSGAMPGATGTRRSERHGLWVWTIVAVIVFVLGLGIFFWHSDQPDIGKVTVFATTDMLVPADVDWLSWKVKDADGKRIVKSGDVTLSDWKQLPVEMAKISTLDATGLLRMELEARRGGEEGGVILESEFQFQMPRGSSKRLEVPLDLLCTKEASPMICKQGQLCRAGECIDVALKDSLEVSEKEPAPLTCFDAAQCFASGMQFTVPVDDPDIGPCVIKRSPAIFNGEKQNIGLVVNTSIVGNYGGCSPTGQCVIPLDYGGSRGWQVAKKGDKTVGIRLPQAVCRGISLNRLIGVAIVPTTPGCPAKSSQTPLCPTPDTCIAKEGICPEDFPSPWIGFECSGSASPQMIRSDVLSCFLPQEGTNKANDAEQPTGKWCCSTGEQPSDDPLLVDDMSGGPQIKYKPASGFGGFWCSASDAVEGDFVPPLAPELFTYRALSTPIPMGGNRTFDRAACLKSSGFTGWYAMMGVGFMSNKGDVIATPVDFSQYTGIRFWGYSQEGEQKIAVRFSDQNTFTEDLRSTCNQNPKGGKCGDDFGVQGLTLTPEWKEYVIKWDELKQSSDEWGQARYESFDRTRVFYMNFTAMGRGPEKQTPPFDFCISQIRFVR